MKRGLLVLIFAAGLSLCVRSEAQVSAYGEFTADYLKGGPNTDALYGGSAGVLFGGPSLFHKLTLSADIQGNFTYSGSTTGPGKGYGTGEAYDALTIGPRIALAPVVFKLAPYVQFNLGFARYHDNFSHSSTDNVYGGQAGVTRRLTPHFAAVIDYSYSVYSYNSGYYSPQSFSVGAMYRFMKQ